MLVYNGRHFHFVGNFDPEIDFTIYHMSLFSFNYDFIEKKRKLFVFRINMRFPLNGPHLNISDHIDLYYL